MLWALFFFRRKNMCFFGTVRPVSYNLGWNPPSPYLQRLTITTVKTMSTAPNFGCKRLFCGFVKKCFTKEISLSNGDFDFMVMNPMVERINTHPTKTSKYQVVLYIQVVYITSYIINKGWWNMLPFAAFQCLDPLPIVVSFNQFFIDSILGCSHSQDSSHH